MGADAGYWEDNWAWVHLIVPAGSQPMAYSANAGTKIFLARGWKKKGGGTVSQNVVYLHISTTLQKEPGEMIRQANTTFLSSLLF